MRDTPSWVARNRSLRRIRDRCLQRAWAARTPRPAVACGSSGRKSRPGTCQPAVPHRVDAPVDALSTGVRSECTGAGVNGERRTATARRQAGSATHSSGGWYRAAAAWTLPPIRQANGNQPRAPEACQVCTPGILGLVGAATMPRTTTEHPPTGSPATGVVLIRAARVCDRAVKPPLPPIRTRERPCTLVLAFAGRLPGRLAVMLGRARIA